MAGKIPFLDPANWIAWNSKAAILYDAYPVSEGHMLVVPIRKGVLTIGDLQPYEAIKLFSLANQAVGIAYTKHNADGVNVGINDGEAAGRTIDHLHIHVIPRYKGDMEDPRGGVRGVIPEFRLY